MLLLLLLAAAAPAATPPCPRAHVKQLIEVITGVIPGDFSKGHLASITLEVATAAAHFKPCSRPPVAMCVCPTVLVSTDIGAVGAVNAFPTPEIPYLVLS